MIFPKLERALCYLALALLPLLTACEPSTVGTNVVGYNHRDRGIVFSVNDQAGAYVQPHKGGGGFTCCVSIPNSWQPGMTAKVEWKWGGTDEWFEDIVPVTKYAKKDIGSMSVHFLRNGEIKVFVTPHALWHPDYPLQGPEAPLDPADTEVAAPW